MKVFGAGISQQQRDAGQYSIGFDVLDIATAFPADPWQLMDSFKSSSGQSRSEPSSSPETAASRALQDPVLDAFADKMRATNPDDPAYPGLAQQALDRWYQDLPAVPAVEKTFVQIFSNKYWTNWPTTGNWYEVPYQWWPSSIFMYFELKPVAQ